MVYVNASADSNALDKFEFEQVVEMRPFVRVLAGQRMRDVQTQAVRNELAEELRTYMATQCVRLDINERIKEGKYIRMATGEAESFKRVFHALNTRDQSAINAANNGVASGRAGNLNAALYAYQKNMDSIFMAVARDEYGRSRDELERMLGVRWEEPAPVAAPEPPRVSFPQTVGDHVSLIIPPNGNGGTTPAAHSSVSTAETLTNALRQEQLITKKAMDEGFRQMTSALETLANEMANLARAVRDQSAASRSTEIVRLGEELQTNPPSSQTSHGTEPAASTEEQQ